MAIWQFEVSLVPRIHSNANQQRSAGRFACTDEELLRRIDQVLPRTKSWSEHILMWGNDSGNRIHAVLNNDRIVELTARIDLRGNAEPFVVELVAIAQVCEAEFISAKNERIMPIHEALQDAIRGSSALRFVKDPKKYLDSRSHS